MKTKIQVLLKALSTKMGKGVEYISKISEIDDINELANIALKLYDDALLSRKLVLYLSDFVKLAEMFNGFSQGSVREKKAIYDRIADVLNNVHQVIMDGNFRNDFNNKYYRLRLKVMIPEKEFSKIALKFYNNSFGEFFYPTDRELPELSKYFFHTSADAMIFDSYSKMALALFSYLRNSSGNLVLKEYFINSNGKIDYNEVELPSDLEKLLYDDFGNGSKIESFEKMYLDALNIGGVESFLEVMNIRRKIDVKRLMSIKKILSNKDNEKERSGFYELYKASKPIISKC